MKIEEKLLEDLLREFSAFTREQQYEQDDLMPYVVFSEFAIYIQEKLAENLISEGDIDKAFTFFNKMALSDDVDELNLLVVSVFEIFTDEPETVALARKHLNTKGRELFEKTLAGWRTSAE